MPKDLRISVLLDFYGEMLTDTQRETLDEYYNQDMSLAEIGEERGISRQGVRDSIKRSKEQLVEMEEKLGLARRFREVQEALAEICDCALEIQDLNAGDIDGIDRSAREIIGLAKKISDEE